MLFLTELFESPSTLFAIAVVIILFALILPFIVIVTSRPFCQVVRYEAEEFFYDENSSRRKFPTLTEPSKVHLSVIVPAYNEENRLKPMLRECLSFLDGRQRYNPNFTYEIIIVNDGSTDRTSSVAAEYTRSAGSEKVRVLNLAKNRGKGGAVRLGVLSSRGAVVLFADADGATGFADITKLEDELKKLINCDYVEDRERAANALAIVCGSRAHLADEAIATRSYFRTILMHGFHFLVGILATSQIKDTQCGFKMFTKMAAAQCFLNLHVERWAFDVEMLYIANLLRISVAEVAVNWTEIEGSKIVPVFSWLQMAVDLFLIRFRYMTGAWDVSLRRLE